MSSEYRFESKLTPAEIMEMLRSTTRLPKGWWCTTGNKLYCKIIDDHYFELVRTGVSGVGGGQPWFVGELREEEGKTVIYGRFKPGSKQRKILAAFMIAPLIPALWMMITKCMDVFVLLLFLVAYLIWILIIYLLQWSAAPRIWSKHCKYVIEHIEKNLLK